MNDMFVIMMAENWCGRVLSEFKLRRVTYISLIELVWGGERINSCVRLIGLVNELADAYVEQTGRKRSRSHDTIRIKQNVTRCFDEKYEGLDLSQESDSHPTKNYKYHTPSANHHRRSFRSNTDTYPLFP